MRNPEHSVFKANHAPFIHFPFGLFIDPFASNRTRTSIIHEMLSHENKKKMLQRNEEMKMKMERAKEAKRSKTSQGNRCSGLMKVGGMVLGVGVAFTGTMLYGGRVRDAELDAEDPLYQYLTGSGSRRNLAEQNGGGGFYGMTDAETAAALRKARTENFDRKAAIRARERAAKKTREREAAAKAAGGGGSEE